MATTIEELDNRLSRVEAVIERLNDAQLRPRIGISLAEAKRRLEQDQNKEWSDEKWNGLMALAGIIDGPSDLAENYKRYLHDDPE